MTFIDFLRILRARWKVALATFLTVVGLGLVVTLLWPKSYTSKVGILIDMKIDPVAGTSAAGLSQSAAYLATQVDIIESGHVSQRVVKDLRLDEDSEMRDEWIAKTEQKGDYIAWLGDKIGAKLKVEPARESNVLELSYSHKDPKFSAAVANAYAKAYVESTVQFRTSPAKQYSNFFEERARLARAKMEAAQTKLAEAQRAKGIVVTDERLDAETAKLNELSSQLATLKGLVADANSRKAATRTSGDTSPDAMASTLINGLRSDLVRMEARLDEALERYGDNHPIIVELRANIASTKGKIRTELGRVNSGVSAFNDVSVARESAIQAAYNEQRERLLKLKQDRNDLALLEHEVASSQRVFEAIQSRQSQMNLEGANSQTNVVLLNNATEPLQPSSPKLVLNMILAVVFGLLLASAAVISIELSDRRIRAATDLSALLDLPVMGVLAEPRQGGLLKLVSPQRNLLGSSSGGTSLKVQ